MAHLQCDTLDRALTYERSPPLVSLLQAIAGARCDLPLECFDGKQVAWAIRTGLGPLFFRAVKGRAENAASPHWNSLRAADLTARVLMGSHFEAMAQIIDLCQEQRAPVILLKGISVAGQCYPEPHQRLMRDLDFLIDRDSAPALEARLNEIGYRPKSGARAADYLNHHHRTPLYHSEKNVWVEIHHRLFSSRKSASRVSVFGEENVRAQLRPCVFAGRQVHRLSDELQLLYLAAHWGQDLKPVGGMIAMIDAIFLLQRCGSELQWQQILEWSRNSVASTYLYLLLSYLQRYRLVQVAPEIMNELSSSQPSFGRLGLRAAHSIVDRYVVEGAAWGRLLNARNVDSVWKTLTLSKSPSLNLALLPVNLFLPDRLRVR